jgi:hypothetical protein
MRMLTVAYGADTTRKSKICDIRQEQIAFQELRSRRCRFCHTVLFPLIFVNNSEHWTSIIMEYWQGYVRCFLLRRLDLCPDAWILRHDNYTAHDMLAVREFLPKNAVTKLLDPPYLQGLDPYDFWLLLKLKNLFICYRFLDSADFQWHDDLSEKREHWLTKCTAAKEDCFECGRDSN